MSESNGAAPNFERLSSSILLHTPSSPAKGQLIILATWMGGAAKHIAKYTTFYKRLIPDTRILLIRGTIEGMLYPYPVQRRNIKPAIPPILQVLSECGASTPPHILLHIFSNGGANSISQLVQVLHQETNAPLPLTGLIIDSALAVGGPRQNYHGVLRSLPKNLIFKLLAPPAVVYALFVLETSIAMGRYPRPETMYRDMILDGALLQVGKPEGDGTAGSKRICYFASTKDATTPFRDVISHAEEAKKKGWDVELHMWDDTAHCNHLGLHEAEYTRAVRRMWEKAKL